MLKVLPGVKLALRGESTILGLKIALFPETLLRSGRPEMPFASGGDDNDDEVSSLLESASCTLDVD